MNRSEMLQNSIGTQEEHDDGISNVIDFSKEENYKKEDKVWLFDYDSIIHQALYSGKNEETGERNPEYTEESLEYVVGKLTEMTLKVLNSVEKYYNPLVIYICTGGKGNFRKDIYPEYKSHRPLPNPLISKLYDYAKVAHQTICQDGYEADDLIATLSKKIDHTGIIIGIDSDLLVLPSINYNFNKDKWLKISEKQAKYNYYKKVCCSDPGDNVKTSPGIGIKYFEKNFSIDFTDEQYEKALLKAYLKAWKNDEIKANEQLELAKQLLTLKIIE